MRTKRTLFLALLATLALALAQEAPAAPGARHGGGYGHYHGGHGWGWGWGLGWGLALGLPLAYGAWGPSYYPSYAYGPVYRGYADPCGLDEECRRAYQAPVAPEAPTTQAPPPAAGEGDGPTQRPLHLNYCDASRAWYPHVRSCPGGWRFVRPEYN